MVVALLEFYVFLVSSLVCPFFYYLVLPAEREGVDLPAGRESRADT
jgi:hypothetical protein